MEFSPRQMRAQTGRFGLTKPRRAKNVDGFLTFPGSPPGYFRAMGLRWGVSSLPCPEVIEERNRMAREIHDTLAQQFAGIFLHLEAANSSRNAEQQN